MNKEIKLRDEKEIGKKLYDLCIKYKYSTEKIKELHSENYFLEHKEKFYGYYPFYLATILMAETTRGGRI